MTRYPGNEFDPAEWLRAWRRALGALIVFALLAGMGWWINGLSADTRAQGALLTGALVGTFAGFCLLAWAVFVVGRPIARSLAALLLLAEKAERKREALEEEHRRRVFE